jgi:hypothetical protein
VVVGAAARVVLGTGEAVVAEVDGAVDTATVSETAAVVGAAVSVMAGDAVVDWSTDGGAVIRVAVLASLPDRHPPAAVATARSAMPATVARLANDAGTIMAESLLR